MADFYPFSMESRAVWHANFAANLPAFAAKYNITAAQLDAVAADNAWMQFWVARRAVAATFSSQLSAYFNSISGPDKTLDSPSTPVLAAATPPDEVPPGIEARVREIARQIKGHSSYAEADGTLIRIIGESSGVQGAMSVPVPEITTVAAKSGYEFTVAVSKRGASDSWQVWATIAGENKWQLIATATGRSAEVAYVPRDQDNRQPYQLQVRVQLRRSNQNYGETSLISQVTVNP